MLICKCDRCGAEIREGDWTVVQIGKKSTLYTCRTIDRDLCPACADWILDWLGCSKEAPDEFNL